jgi:hypothetical protein
MICLSNSESKLNFFFYLSIKKVCFGLFIYKTTLIVVIMHKNADKVLAGNKDKERL